MARQRERLKRDVEVVKCNEGGRVLVEDEEVRKRWESYFCKLMNEGVEEGADDDRVAMMGLEGEVGQVTVGEVVKVLKKMKNGKAVGPNGIPVEVWKLGTGG